MNLHKIDSNEKSNKVLDINITSDSYKNQEKYIQNHGGNRYDNILLITLLSYVFLDDIELNYKLRSKNNISNSNDILGYLITWRPSDDSIGHSTSAFYCNNNLYHYNDNEPELKLINSVSELASSEIVIKSEITNKKLTITECLLISIYDYTGKENKMNQFLQLELLSNIFSNINYYYNNGADDYYDIDFFFKTAKQKKDIKTLRLLMQNFNFKDRYKWNSDEEKEINLLLKHN
jgi:hypothetical protein